MGKRARRKGFSGAVARATRAAAMAQDEDAQAVAVRVYNAVREGKQTGEAGDISPLAWGPLAVAAEMFAAAVVAADEELNVEDQIDVAAYFTSIVIAAGRDFDTEHFAQWRKTLDEPDAPAEDL